jgi:hypothetical protein
VSAPLPSGLGWDTTNWPLSIGLQVSAVSGRAFGTLGTGSFDITTNAKYIACLAGAAYYVDVLNGSDANNGLIGTPTKSIWAAQVLLNGTGSPGRIYVANTGTYAKAQNFTLNSGSNFPTVDTMFIATGGRVTVTTHDGSLTWTADGTYTNTYGSSSLTSAPSRVLDIANRDAYGLYPDFAKANSAAECNAKPWTYFWDGATKLYVNRGDGLVVSTSTNTWVLRTGPNFSYTGAYQHSFFFVGTNPGDGFDLVGGSNAASTQGTLNYSSGLTITAATASAGTITCTVSSTSTMTSGQSCKIVGSTGLAFDGTYTATVVNSTTFTVPSAATGTYTGSSGSVCQNYSRTHTVYAKNCSFRYAGFWNGAQNGNGTNVNNFSGTSIFIGCDASGNSSDGFNFHDSRVFGHQALTLNCTGIRNGLVGSTSNNGWTSHEGTVGIDIAGYYWANAGYTCASIDTSKSLFVGTVAGASRGDKIFGGSYDPGEFRVLNSATYWCFATLALPTSGSGYAYAASDTSTIYYRSLRPYFGAVVKDSGATFTAY